MTEKEASRKNQMKRPISCISGRRYMQIICYRIQQLLPICLFVYSWSCPECAFSAVGQYQRYLAINYFSNSRYSVIPYPNNSLHWVSIYVYICVCACVLFASGLNQFAAAAFVAEEDHHAGLEQTTQYNLQWTTRLFSLCMLYMCYWARFGHRRPYYWKMTFVFSEFPRYDSFFSKVETLYRHSYFFFPLKIC